jgi:transcriptional regulator with XRE-family HTH domain
MSEDLSLSEELRRAREARGESLEQVYQRTGIAFKLLQGLESDDFEVVEPVYARLAINHYADYLGLDGKAFEERLCNDVPAMRPPPPVLVHTSPAAATHSLPKPSPLADLIRSQPPARLATGGVILVVGLAIMLYLLGSDTPTPSAPTGSSPRAPAPRAVEQSQIATAMPFEPMAAAEESIESSVTAAGDDAQAMEPVTDPADQGEPSAEVPPLAEAPGPASADLAAGPLILQVDALDSTWVQVQWDDDDGVVEIIPSGEQRTWAAQRFFMVRAGRAHGVHFRFQGKLLGEGRLGDPTKVLRFHASAGGVQLLGPDLAPIAQIQPDTMEAVGRVRP